MAHRIILPLLVGIGLGGAVGILAERRPMWQRVLALLLLVALIYCIAVLTVLAEGLAL